MFVGWVSDEEVALGGIELGGVVALLVAVAGKLVAEGDGFTVEVTEAFIEVGMARFCCPVGGVQAPSNKAIKKVK